MQPTKKSTQPRSDLPYAWLVCGFLLFAIWLIYGQTLDHALLDYDDALFVSTNPLVTAGLTGEGVHWAFTNGPAGEWYPLAPLSHMLDCQLWGLDPWGHHLTNVLLHAAGSIALFLVLWRMTDELWPSAFVATVFAVHPQHVESVAWIAERRDVLSGLLFMLTLGAYLGYVRHGRSPARYLLVAVLLALGLMAKPMLVTVPPLLLLLDFWPLARSGAAGDTPGWTKLVERPGVRQLVLEKIPLFALAAGDCWMTLRTHHAGTAEPIWSERIGNAAVSCVMYVVQFFYPFDLAVFYPNPVGGPPIWKVGGAISILLAASAAAVVWRRAYPFLFVGWFWYLGMLAPVAGLIQVTNNTMADRYMYLPGIGLYIALAWGAARLAGGSPEASWALGGCSALAIAGLIAVADQQTTYWRDDETLWRRALDCTTDNSTAEFCLGFALARQGRYDEAIVFYRRALGGEPDSYTTHVNLAAALARRNQPDESVRLLRRALEIDRRGLDAYLTLAHLLVSQGKFDEARVELERAIAVEPQSSAAHNDLGSALFMQGKIAESIPEYEAALALDPTFVLAHNNLADALAKVGRVDEAIAHYRRALELDPQNRVARAELEKLLQGK